MWKWGLVRYGVWPASAGDQRAACQSATCQSAGSGAPAVLVRVCVRCSCSFASASRRRRACSRSCRVASEPSGWNIPAVRLRGAPPPEGAAAISSSPMPHRHMVVTLREELPPERDRIGTCGSHKGRRRLGRRPGLVRIALRGSCRRPHLYFTSPEPRETGVFRFRVPQTRRMPGKSAPLCCTAGGPTPGNHGISAGAARKVVQICSGHRPGERAATFISEFSDISCRRASRHLRRPCQPGTPHHP